MAGLLAGGCILLALLAVICRATRSTHEEAQALSSHAETLFTQCCVKDGFNVDFEDVKYQELARATVQTVAWARTYYEEAASDAEEYSYVQNASTALSVSGPTITLNSRLRDGITHWRSMPKETQDSVYKVIQDFLDQYEIQSVKYIARKPGCPEGFVDADVQHRCNKDFAQMQNLLYTLLRLHTADAELKLVEDQQARLEEMVKQLTDTTQVAATLRTEKDRLLKKVHKLSSRNK